MDTTGAAMNLTESDLRMLAASWITPALAEAAGLRRVDPVEGAHLAGRNGSGDYAGIAIPYAWPGAPGVREYQLRIDRPELERLADGTTKEKAKYLFPPGRSNILYVPPGAAPAMLEDAGLPVVICEGAKKCLALWRLATEGRERPRFMPVAVSGVWNWRGTVGREAGPDGARRAVKGPIPDLSRIAWAGRVAIIIFDSDKQRNASIGAAEQALARELKSRGAAVRTVDLPDLPQLDKTGADDYLAHGDGGPERMAALLDGARPVEPPAINAADQDLDRATRAAWEALACANFPAYMFRHGTLVRLEFDESGAPVLRELTLERVRYELARGARYFVAKDDETVPAHPPVSVCRNILATPDPPLPALSRIVEVPVFSRDGRLQLEPGYHPETRTYLASGDFDLADLPEKPDKDDLLQARTRIDLELLGDFPFASEAERTNAVALFVLPYVRDMIDGPTPLHLIEKPCPGTGASLLADAVSYPATGRSIAATTEGRDEDEWRKRLTAKLAAGPAFVLFDNLRRRLDSSNVSAAITAMSWEDRRLGMSEMIQIPVRCAWIATGNNPALSAEIARRTIRIRLDAKNDRPWLRTKFKHPDLRAWMKEKRADLVWSALVLVRRWIATGRPKAPPSVQRLGMFESWTEVIGGILTACGYQGFLANLDAFYSASDAEGATWRAFVEAWWKMYQETEVGSSDLYSLAGGLDLREGSERSQRTRLGILLGSVRDRQFGSYRIVWAGQRQGAQTYQLQQVKVEDVKA